MEKEKKLREIGELANSETKEKPTADQGNF